MHQTPGAFWTDCTRMKVRFLFDYQKDEVRIDSKPRAIPFNKVVDNGSSGGPSVSLPVLTCRRVQVLTLNACNTLTTKEYGQVLAIVPGAVCYFSYIVDTQPGPIVQINPGNLSNSRQRFRLRICDDCLLCDWRRFFITVCDAFYFAIDAARNALYAVPDRAALFPRIIDIDAVAVAKQDSLANYLTCLWCWIFSGRRRN